MKVLKMMKNSKVSAAAVAAVACLAAAWCVLPPPQQAAAAETPAANAASQAKGKDIVDTAVSAGSFKTLAAALKAAGLVETLKG